jgi:phosphoglycolate phosphatase-like HAD superfamily hydrolase
MKKALHWSESVNASIRQLPPLHTFESVAGALRYAHNHADIAIVSSANREAVIAEWESHGLMAYVDTIMTQESGSKHACIAKLLDGGYEREHVLMCGDAPGDAQAAKENDVYFYPILADREEESWRDFIDIGLARFLSGDYMNYERIIMREFYLNLGGEGESAW